MSFIKLLVFGIIMVFVFELSAQQTDTSATLSGVEIKAKPILQNQSDTKSTQNISKVALKTYSTSSLNELLSKTANITIKQYGASGISSVSMRGGNANHTAVLWNGFNLQDPLNGEFNLAQSSLNIVDEISVNYGGNSALFGSGAVGGIIALNNKAKFNSGLAGSIQQSVGSFGKTNTLASISYGNKKLFFKTRAFYSYIENDFEYTNSAKGNSPTEILQNSAVKQYGILQEAYYLIDNKSKISTQLWYQKNHSQISPNMTVSNGYSNQYDDVLRIATAYNRKFNNWDLTIRNGIAAATQNYVDDNIYLDAVHKSFNNITDVIANYKLNKTNSLLAGINNDFNRCESDNYADTMTINKTALFVSYKYQKDNKLMLNGNIRSEILNGEIMPATYGLKIEYYVFNFLTINSNLSKNHHTPNFNDLYWVGPGASGNPDLVDEDGYSADIGSNFFINKKRFMINANATAYFSRFSDLIMWQEIDGIWMPQNKKLVDTKGVEFRANGEFKHTKNIKTFASITYTYTSSKLKGELTEENKNVIDKQLVYIPLYQANANVGITAYGVSLAVSVKYVGQRYIYEDNSDWLDGYILTDLNLNYSIKDKKLRADVFAKANNIFNTEYMIRNWYPTPMINYELGIKLYINK